MAIDIHTNHMTMFNGKPGLKLIVSVLRTLAEDTTVMIRNLNTQLEKQKVKAVSMNAKKNVLNHIKCNKLQ